MPASSPGPRRARPDDVAEIHALVVELAEYERSRHEVKATPDDFQTALFGSRPAVYAHVIDDPSRPGRLAGFALWFLNFSTWEGRHGLYLEDLYVRPEHRGAGYGQQLLTALAQECLEQGYRRLEWWVLDWNEPALGFYRSLGAIPMDEWTVHRVTGEALTALAGRTLPGA